MRRRCGAAFARLCVLAVVQVCLLGSANQVSAQARDWPSERPPRPLSARDIKFPPYQLQTLPNGLQIVAVSHHEQPVVSMRLLFRVGTSSDPKGKLGLARLAASLLDQGTEARSAEELNDAIDFIGGAMGAGAGNDLSFLNMVVMKDSFETGLRMMSDVARHPGFRQADIDRQRQQTLSALQVSLADPEWIANAVFDRLVYGFHPYGMPDSGTPDTIAGITRDDLLAFHSKYFAPNNAILAVVGDVTAEEAFAMTAKVFGDWPRKEVIQEKPVQPPDPTRRVIVINKPDAVQTEIRVGHTAIARKHDDYMTLNLATRILGGEGSNRLHQVLRTERGLTYGAQAAMTALKDAGDIVAETNTRTEATGEVLRLIVDEFWRLRRERVGERELSDAKAYMTGSFPLTIETPDAIATQVLNVIFYGLPLDQLQTLRERVNTVNVDHLQQIALYYLRPDQLSVVLVGNLSGFASQLRGVGFGKYEVIEVDDLDLISADFKRPKRVGGRLGGAGGPIGLRLASYQVPDRSAQPAVASEQAAKARVLLDRVIAAKGGLDALRAIRSIRAVASASMASPGRPTRADTTTILEYPNHVRVETETPQGAQVQVYDGEHGWVSDEAGLHEVRGAAIRGMQDGLRRNTVAALLAAERGDLRVRILPDVADDAGRLHQALEVSSPTMDPLVFYVDPLTGLIARQTFLAGGPGQPLVEEIFSDYRPVSGVQVAFAAELRRNGQSLLQRRVTALTINPSIDSALFKRPAS